MEGCSILLVILAAIIAVVGWRRLSRRLTATETRLAELELDLGRLRSPAPQPAEQTGDSRAANRGTALPSNHRRLTSQSHHPYPSLTSREP